MIAMVLTPLRRYVYTRPVAISTPTVAFVHTKNLVIVAMVLRHLMVHFGEIWYRRRRLYMEVMARRVGWCTGRNTTANYYEILVGAQATVGVEMAGGGLDVCCVSEQVNFLPKITILDDSGYV